MLLKFPQFLLLCTNVNDTVQRSIQVFTGWLLVFSSVLVTYFSACEIQVLCLLDTEAILWRNVGSGIEILLMEK